MAALSIEMIETMIAHAAVVPVGTIPPPRSAHVGPIVVIVVGPKPPRKRIPPSAVVITIPSVPKPKVAEMTRSKVLKRRSARKMVMTDNVVTDEMWMADVVMSSEMRMADNVMTGKMWVADVVMSSELRVADNTMTGKMRIADNVMTGEMWSREVSGATGMGCTAGKT